MARVALRCLMVFLAANTVAVAQVKISVPAPRYKPYEEIQARVDNATDYPITMCVEIAETSPKAPGEIESTPSPFWVQQQNNKGKWGTLTNGPDVGSLKVALSLKPGESRVFPIRLSGSGKTRPRPSYWPRTIPGLDSHTSPKGSKVATSTVFTVY